MHYQIDELTAPLIKKAFLMYVNGRQIKDIVEYLNEHVVLSSQKKTLTKEQMIFWLSNMTRLDLLNNDNKQRVVDTFINSIYVYDDEIVVNFNCREESERIPLGLEGVSSVLQGVGSQMCQRRTTQMVLLCSFFIVTDRCSV